LSKIKVLIINIVLLVVLAAACSIDNYFKWQNSVHGAGYVETNLVYDVVESWQGKLLKITADIDAETCEGSISKLEQFIDFIPADQQAHRLSAVKIDAYEALIDCYIKTDSYKVGKVFEDLLLYDPYNFTIYTDWAEYEYGDDDFRVSLEIVEKALAVNPDYIEAQELKIRALNKLEEYDEILELLAQIKETRITQVDSGHVFLGNDQTGFLSENSFPLNDVIIDDELRTYSLPLHVYDFPILNDGGEVTQVRIDPLSSDNYLFYLDSIEFLGTSENVVSVVSDFSNFETRNIEKYDDGWFYSTSLDPFLYGPLLESVKDVYWMKISMQVSWQYSEEVLDIISNVSSAL
jgi:tetratricopeptide (TPR) repeat protein